MDRILLKDRIELLKNYYRYGESATNSLRESNLSKNYQKRPSVQDVSDIVAKFERTGTLSE